MQKLGIVDAFSQQNYGNGATYTYNSLYTYEYHAHVLKISEQDKRLAT